MGTSVDVRFDLAQIRKKLESENAAYKLNMFSCDTVPQGVPRGVICEVTGSARTEWILSLMKQNSNLNTFWAEESLTLLPTALHQRGIDLSRVLMAETHELLFPALRKALQSKLFDCIVLPGKLHEVKILKALQLFARESNAGVFFLSKQSQRAWAIQFQVEAEWTDPQAYAVKVLKKKLYHSSLS